MFHAILTPKYEAAAQIGSYQGIHTPVQFYYPIVPVDGFADAINYAHCCGLQTSIDAQWFSDNPDSTGYIGNVDQYDEDAWDCYC